MLKKNHNLYNATYGDKMYCASKIASHGLEYNDVVKSTYNNGVADAYYVSPVYVLNDDWIITQINEIPGGTMNEGFYEPTDFDYWTKTDYTSRVRTKTLALNLREDIDASASMSFNCDTTWQPEIGMTVVISYGTETLFTGHVSTINKTKLSFGRWKADVTVAPLLACLQWHLFLYPLATVEYLLSLADTGTRNTLELIMTNLSGYPGNYTGGQAVWLGAIDEGNSAVSMPESFGKTIYELSNSVCASAGLALLMTADRRLKCVSLDRTPTAAPRNISDAAETAIRDITYSDDMSSFGSFAILRGGYDSNGAPVIAYAAVSSPVTESVYGAIPNKAVVMSDGTITNATDAGAAAAELLKKTGTVIPGVLSFLTDYTDFRPGQKIEVDLDDWGIASTKYMLIDSVTMYDADGKNLMCNVTCSNRDSTSFAAAPNKGSNSYMTDLSNKVTQSVSALTQSAGSFTPTLYGSTTAGTWAYTTQDGYYNIHGNQCYVNIRLNASSIADAVGNLMIGGLPKPASTAATLYNLPAMATGLAWGASMTQLQLSITDADDFGTLYGAANNAAWVAVGVADISTGDEIRISGVYLV